MATVGAQTPAGSAVRFAARAGWFGGAGLLALLLLVAVISTSPTVGCSAEDTASGDVLDVGRYPRPLTFGGATLLPAQLVFADVVAKRTRWDLAVIRAQVYNEMNGSFATRRVRERNHNWLNVSYDDNLGGQGRLDGRRAWSNPVSAGNATADWIEGRRQTLGEVGSQRIRSAYAAGAMASPQEAIGLLQRSGWASGGYPNLPAIYERIAGGSGRGSKPGSLVNAGLAGGSARCAADDLPTGGGVSQAAAIARAQLGKTGPEQMPGFTGAFPRNQWCSWFVTNVLRRAGVDIPVLNYSGAPYDWAVAHPGRWSIFKPVGKPASGVTPPVGSLVMYRRGGGGSPSSSDHINMVERTYAGGSFDLIGGNQTCPRGGPTCVSERKACRLIGWRRSPEPHLDCGDSRPIWGIVTPTASGSPT